MFGRVMPFEPFDEAPGFGGREGLVEGCRFVGVEIVLHEDDPCGFREVNVG